MDWYPWSDEAFELARRLKRPVLLSVGYSTCHWCHVMEEESFEDLEIADFLNANFVAIKVDREERPDIDSVYMSAAQALSGSGGWPMTVFMTANREPFYAGTYFPPRDGERGGRPGFLGVLGEIKSAYTDRPDEVVELAKRIVGQIRAELSPIPSVGVLDGTVLLEALNTYRTAFDVRYAGLKRRTKFPSSLPIRLLHRVQRRNPDQWTQGMALRTLEAMRKGGLYDHVAGGFHRYTVDQSWSVPHFEKMLYDNALLVPAYVESWQMNQVLEHRALALDVLEYVTREMTSDGGSFYSATDADSEGEEGRFFVWTREAVRQAVGPELAEFAISSFGLEGDPNFESESWVLRRDDDPLKLSRERGVDLEVIVAELAQIRRALYAARLKRGPPLRDEKRLMAWNGLMISAFAFAGASFQEPELVQVAARAADDFLKPGIAEGRAARYLKRDPASESTRAHGRALLDDYSFFIAGLLDLFETSGERRWLESALVLQEQLDTYFTDADAGGYWMTPSDGEALLVREKPSRDGALPSGNSIAARNLQRLFLLTHQAEFQQAAEMALRAFSDLVEEDPGAYGVLLEAVDFAVDTPKEIVIVSPNHTAQAERFQQHFGESYVPNRMFISVSEEAARALEDLVPLLKHKRALGGSTTAYVCENRVCEAPTQDPAAFRSSLEQTPRPLGKAPAENPRPEP